MEETTTTSPIVQDRATARASWLAEKAAVHKRYRSYVRKWVRRKLARMEKRGKIPVSMSLERFVKLRSKLIEKVPEYDDATGSKRKSSWRHQR
jgi:hypothetical protein